VNGKEISQKGKKEIKVEGVVTRRRSAEAVL
jgi:hypothetical protein